MSALETRGGFPFVQRWSAPVGTDPAHVRAQPGHVKYLQVYNEGGFPVRLYFTEADYTADENYLELPATTGEWEGPVELRERALWSRGVGGTSDPVVAVFYLRR